MLHEVYAPRTVADVAWSRQKIVTLSTVIQQARGRGKALSSAAPHIVLLYGPPGCGKLETLKVLLCEDAALVDAPVLATHSTSHAGPCATSQLAQCHSTSFHIFHTCEATVPAYAQYLNSVVSYCRGQLGGAELQLPSLTESPASCMSSGGRSSSAGSRAGTMAGSAGSTELSTNHAHIIKFYGEPASHALHRCTLLFLREYEELRAMAQHEEQEQGPLLSSGTRLDLSTSFPSTLLQSPAVELFHCTPITEINLRKRLQSILDAKRKASTPTSAAAIATATACTASSSIDLIDPETLNAIVAGSQGDIRQALLQVQWLCLMPASNSLVPAAHQSGESVEGAWSQAAQAAATIWMRLEKQRLAARQGVVAASAGVADARVLSLSGTTDVGLSIYASHSTPCVSPAKPASKASGVVHREGKDEDGEIDSERESDVVEEVSSKGSGETVHIFSSAEFTSFPEPQTSRNGDDKTHAKVGGAASRKRPRQLSSPPAVNMLSLLDSQMERMQAMADVDGQRRRGPKSRAGRFAHRGAAPPASATGSQQRSVLPMTRDEYLGLSHAIGRLLTQKYCIDEVLGTLNVPPRKILDYLTNNQIRYFGDDQLPQYARCIDAASDADALRASELSGSFAGVPNAAALRERRQLADRTTAGENLGNMGRLLESIALQLFHLTYRAIQTEVRPPPGFVAQEPPPYLRLAYPRLRDISYSAMPYSMRRGEDRTEADPAAYISEREWVQQALARLESVPAVGARGSSASYGSDSNRRRRFDAGAGGGSSSHATLTPRIQAEEVDVLREGLPDLLYRCGSTEAVLLDYYALAPYILLTVSPPLPLQSSHAERIPASAALASLSQACEGTNTTAQSRGVHIAPDAPSLPSCSPGTSTMLTTAPRRTVFRFASSSLSASAPPLPVPSAHSVNKRPCLRPCTPLQMAILQRGRNPATAQLRSDLFVLSTDGVGDRTAGAATEGSAERPLIPPGDEIEDIDED
ncbi:Rad17 cell cycle checkpoint family protein [Leishmania donovani]|uniref:Rad17 cell cycle checkpoint family protein n=1 Tax=Leishmania donovani TaxID=5661 RepID=A0A504X4W3_LEIDO|nr:Rad17 cell cycle checkpoint family protein [Leishmania donovani]